jgi:hypothetical protein
MPIELNNIRAAVASGLFTAPRPARIGRARPVSECHEL